MVPGLEEAPLGDKEMGQAVTDLVFYTPQPDLPIVRKVSFVLYTLKLN